MSMPMKTLIKEKIGEALSAVGEALTEQAHRDVTRRQLSQSMTQTDYQTPGAVGSYDETASTIEPFVEEPGSDVRDRTSWDSKARDS